MQFKMYTHNLLHKHSLKGINNHTIVFVISILLIIMIINNKN